MSPWIKENMTEMLTAMLEKIPTSGWSSNTYRAVLTVRDALHDSGLVSRELATELVAGMIVEIPSSLEWDDDMQEVVDLFAQVMVESARLFLRDEFSGAALVTMMTEMSLTLTE